jgi:purine-binding chemotaxis protein CheW
VLSQSADALRRAFDDAFSVEAVVGIMQTEGLLAIRLRGDPHLLRLADVGSLQRVGALLRYPSPTPAWLGLAGVSGRVVPVFDLGVLAGYPPGAAPAWIAVCSGAPVALAFDAFDGQIRHVRKEATADAPVAASFGEVRRIGNEPRPIIDVAALIERLRASIPGSSGAPAPASTSSPSPLGAADQEI